MARVGIDWLRGPRLRLVLRWRAVPGMRILGRLLALSGHWHAVLAMMGLRECGRSMRESRRRRERDDPNAHRASPSGRTVITCIIPACM